jgi:hypothetical protein
MGSPGANLTERRQIPMMEWSKFHLHQQKCSQATRSMFTAIVGCVIKELCRWMEHRISQIEAPVLAD